MSRIRMFRSSFRVYLLSVRLALKANDDEADAVKFASPVNLVRAVTETYGAKPSENILEGDDDAADAVQVASPVHRVCAVTETYGAKAS